jgi:hypothetical protein
VVLCSSHSPVRLPVLNIALFVENRTSAHVIVIVIVFFFFCPVAGGPEYKLFYIWDAGVGVTKGRQVTAFDVT